MDLLQIGIFLLLAHVIRAEPEKTSPLYFVVAPNVIHLDTDEVVTLTLFGVDTDIFVEVSLMDFPNQSLIYYSDEAEVKKDTSANLTVRLSLEELPDTLPDPFYVTLVAESTSLALPFKQEVAILVDDSPGFIFIQTDKPIYTPGQTVRIRVIPLDDNTLPAGWPVHIDIINPDGVTVSRSTKEANEDIVKDSLKIPDIPVFGNWTVSAKFANGLKTSAAVRFEVREYVLPTFTVTFHVAEMYKVILPGDEDFQATVHARYVFGKPVKGHVTVTYGLVWHGHVFTMGKQRNIELNDTGKAEFSVRTEDVKLPVESVWFPNGGRLFLEAIITEEASGKVEHAVDQSVVFAETAFIFKFTRSSRYFKPGLPYILHIDAFRANGDAAILLPVQVKCEGEVRDQKIPIMSWGVEDQTVFRTDDNGRMALEFRLPPGTKNIRFTLRSKKKGIPKSAQSPVYFGAIPYYSPSDTFMLVKAAPTAGDFPSSIPDVGDYLTVKTINTAPVDLEIVNLLVVSRGRITFQSRTRNLFGNTTTFHIPVSPKMSPNMRILAFSVRGAGRGSEVIADSTWVDVEEKCDAEITMTTNLPGKKHSMKPGSSGTLTLKGVPHMRVGILAVDKAVYILKNEYSLSRSKVFDALKKMDRGCGRGGGRDSASVFQDAGLTVLTNAGLRTEPRSKEGCPAKAVRRKRSETEMKALEDMCCQAGYKASNGSLKMCFDLAKVVKQGTKSLKCARHYFKCCKDAINTPESSESGGRISKPGETGLSGADLEVSFDGGDMDVEEIPLRSNFPESWWFDDYDLGDKGEKDVAFTLPDSITTWMVHAIGVSRTRGFCVGKPHNITAFKNFFIQLDLPYSAIRLEQLEVRATVYNYMDRKILVKMYLSSIEGICYSGEPGENSDVTEIDVPPFNAASVSFPIIPLEIGEYPIKVFAYSTWGRDAVEKKLKVEGEGLEKIHTVSIMLDPSGKRLIRERPTNSSFSLRTQINAQENRQKVELDLDLPKEVIPQTDACSLSAIGDLMGPTVTGVVEGVDTLLRLPTGCGEQNLIFLAPNVYVLRYLRASNRLPSAVERKARTYIREGMNRQLTFRKKDGSYGTWPHSHSSTWLTAFALKTFTQAIDFVSVDDNVTCAAFEWLLHRQNPNGSFSETAWVMHKEMLGGINGDATLTAFVLISLLECRCRPLVPNISNVTRLRAVNYLEKQLPNLDRPLAVAMTTYALILADSPMKHQANEKLNSIAQTSVDGLTFWGKGQEDHFSNQMKPYWYAKKPGALAVEASSYGLLAKLELGEMKESNSIAGWLMQQRESHGSFISTQDTVIGLQALSEYSIRTYSAILDMTCDIRSEADQGFQESISLKHEEAFILKSIPKVPTGGKLHFEATGTGVGMMQVEVRFNIPDDDDNCRFDVTIDCRRLSHLLTEFFWQRKRSQCEPCSQDCEEEEEESAEDIETFTFPSIVPRIQYQRRQKNDKEDNSAENPVSKIGRPFSRIGKPRYRRSSRVVASAKVLCVKVCVKYQGKRETGMSVLDVGLFTGYQPIESDLKKLKKRGKIQHFEISQRSVIFYLEEISHKKNECVKFRAKQKHVAENMQPAKVQVYDYYNPDEKCTKFYKPDNASGHLANFCDKQKRICQCLEGRCGRCENVWQAKTWTQHVKYACQNSTNVLVVKILDTDKTQAGFERMLGLLQKIVYQTGQRQLKHKEKLILLKRSSCVCPVLEVGKTYVLMMKNPKKFKDVEGNEIHAFLLDQKALAVEYYKPRQKGLDASKKKLARNLKRTIRRLSKRGCRKRKNNKARTLRKNKKGRKPRKNNRRRKLGKNNKGTLVAPSRKQGKMQLK